MKLSEIYYDAACKISNGEVWYACTAIRQTLATNQRQYRARKLFRKIFGPKDKGGSKPYVWFGSGHIRKNQHDRFVTLLFMAEMAKDIENEKISTREWK